MAIAGICSPEKAQATVEERRFSAAWAMIQEITGFNWWTTGPEGHFTWGPGTRP
jgi:hypothetical protein